MILVVGATGVLGGMVTRALLARGDDVRMLVREGSNYAPLVAAGATPAVGDLKEQASLDAACRDIDTIVTTATAIIRRPPDTIETVDDAGYENLIEAAKRAGVRHFVYTSALGSSPDSPVPLMRIKALNEQRLRESGMPYTILMPNLYIEVWGRIIVAAPLAQGKPVMLRRRRIAPPLDAFYARRRLVRGRCGRQPRRTQRDDRHRWARTCLLD